MPDKYQWNYSASVHRAAIVNFLEVAQAYIRNNQHRVQCHTRESDLVINTLRGLLDKTPAQMTAKD